MRCYAVALAGIMMGSLAIFVRNIHTDPLTLTFFRFSFGAIFLLPFVRDLKIDDPKLILCVAMMNLATVSCYIASIQTLEVATSALLLYMAPVYVTVYVWLKEGSLDGKSLLALLLAITGLLLMLTPYGRLSIGIIFGLLSGVFYAILFIVTKKARESMPSINLTFLSLAISSVILSPILLKSYEIVFDNLFWIIGLGLIPTSLAFTLFNYGIKHCKIEKAPILALIEPVSAGIFGYIFFGEILTPKQILGATLILSAILLTHD